MTSGILLSWSGGKDSSLALREISASRRYKVEALVTTLTEQFDRISMHGVRRSLLQAQASSLGLPLEEVWIPRGASNQLYDERMRALLVKYLERGVKEVAFGDLFLRDVRAYREDKLAQIGMKGAFPLWGKDT
ncbi:MAG TPA: ATP-binding protein, partial [Nitrososphaerales archaeon]|nr:ATP-binding protein [Nitrososphaerales archaeon]